ncbi:hypothetical protein LSM04_005436 [Trypanosoma melophagium]|uniref:uncharacterized protein n=1 Tax=Trypanosoma melophagium TaxID=715481 RepID=UPI00351AAEE7|nr:hypothetical protein LSM04_005436 [Trypanosoma melophagium]
MSGYKISDKFCTSNTEHVHSYNPNMNIHNTTTSYHNPPYNYTEIHEENHKEKEKEEETIREKAWEETVGLILQWVSGAIEGDGDSLDLVEYLLEELDGANIDNYDDRITTPSCSESCGSCSSLDNQTGVGNTNTNTATTDPAIMNHQYIIEAMMKLHERSSSFNISEGSQEMGSIEQYAEEQHSDSSMLMQQEEKEKGVYSCSDTDWSMDNTIDNIEIKRNNCNNSNTNTTTTTTTTTTNNNNNNNNSNRSSCNFDFMKRYHDGLFDAAILLRLADEVNALEVDKNNSVSRVEVINESVEDSENAK